MLVKEICERKDILSTRDVRKSYYFNFTLFERQSTTIKETIILDLP